MTPARSALSACDASDEDADPRLALTAGVSLLSVLVWVRIAWPCDGFISLRQVGHLVGGHGPVFNVASA